MLCKVSIYSQFQSLFVIAIADSVNVLAGHGSDNSLHLSYHIVYLPTRVEKYT